MKSSKRPLFILFITPYYPPEMGAAQTRISDLAVRLVHRGHNITVLTGFPNYPSGVIHKDYRGKFFLRECVDGVDVVRTWIYPTSNTRLYWRLINYFSFIFSSIVSSFRCRRPDVIYVESPPLFNGISGFVISKLKRAPFLFNVADLWPDFAVELGLVGKGYHLSAAYKLESFIYRKAARIATVSNGLIKRLGEEKRIPVEKLVLFRNGVDIKKYDPGLSGAGIRRKLNLEGKFIAGFIGNIGHWQGVETLIDAAEILKDRPDFHLLIIGDGAKKEAVKQYLNEKNLRNVTMLPVQERASIPEFWSAVDCAAVPLRKVSCANVALPVKMLEALGMGKPVVLGIHGEAEEMIKDAEAGIIVEPENPHDYAEAFKKLAADGNLRGKMGNNGREYAEKHLNREKLALTAEKVLIQIAEEHGKR